MKQNSPNDKPLVTSDIKTAINNKKSAFKTTDKYVIESSQNQPMCSVFSELCIYFSNRLVMPRCSSERFGESFVPAAVKFLNEHC